MISRFVDRRPYVADEIDRQAIIQAIGRADSRWDWFWLSYALMSTHLHYGQLAGEADPSPFFASLNTRIAQGFHRRRPRETIGPVLADRPKVHPVSSANLARLVAYHHRNPVEAGVVHRAAHSRWTSHRAYLRLEPAPAWLDVERALDLLGFSDTASGRREFDDFVMGVDLRERVQSDDCPTTEQLVRPGPLPIDWEKIRTVVCRSLSLPLGGERSKRPTAVLARALVALIATRDFGQTFTAVGVVLGMHPGSVSNLVRRCELREEVREKLRSCRAALGLVAAE